MTYLYGGFCKISPIFQRNVTVHRGRHVNNFGWAESAAHGPRSAKYDAIDYVIFDTRQ